MPEKDDTVVSRPMPKRPENGLLAWQATIGYISAQYSLDAMLTLQAYPIKKQVGWSAQASWGQNVEVVEDRDNLPAALRELWQKVAQNHVIFETKEAALKRPANYDEDEWLDDDTRLVLERLVQVTRSVYALDWLLVMVYQPVENPTMRFQARLLAHSNTVTVAGLGPNLITACRDLYRNAAPYFVGGSGKIADEI